MHRERWLRLIGGIVVLGSVPLAQFVSPRWLILTALVGLNLLQSAFTDWCPMVWVLDKLGVPGCRAERPAPGG